MTLNPNLNYLKQVNVVKWLPTKLYTYFIDIDKNIRPLAAHTIAEKMYHYATFV